MKDELDVAPDDARYDFKTKELSPDKPGRRIDAWSTLGRLDDALAHGAPSLDAVDRGRARPPHRRAARGRVDRRGPRLVRDEVRARPEARGAHVQPAPRGVEARRLRALARGDVRLQPGRRRAQRGERLQGGAGHRAGGARRRHRRRHVPDRRDAARRGVLRGARHPRPPPAHATELLHQDGARRGGRLPDGVAQALEPDAVPGGAARDGAGGDGPRRDPRAEAYARRDLRAADRPGGAVPRARRRRTRSCRRGRASSSSAASRASR